MGPLCRRRSKTTSSRKSSSRKKTSLSKIQKSKNQETLILPPISPMKPSSKDMEIDAELCGCSTPKAERFRIPEIKTCPPAPKKRRVITPPCSLRRTSIAFFAPPDIDLFFNLALRGGIPV